MMLWPTFPSEFAGAQGDAEINQLSQRRIALLAANPGCWIPITREDFPAGVSAEEKGALLAMFS